MSVSANPFHLSRRRFLSSATLFGAASLGGIPNPARANHGAVSALAIDSRVIEVKGKPAKVFGILRPDGGHGLVVNQAEGFRVDLVNRLDALTLVHWHGLKPPYGQDGVPDLPQPPLAAGARYGYDFPLAGAGTHWMHSHHGLTEQQLLAAPLIVAAPDEAGQDVQQIVVLFHDFTFRDPQEILAELTGGSGEHAGHQMPETDMSGMDMNGMDMSGMNMSGMGMGMSGMAMGGGHLHDVEYDAYLANDRSLDDPEVTRVEAGGKVRLRLINGAAATNFWIHLGELEGSLIAVDGNPIEPVTGNRFPFAIAQRLDILIDLPKGEGAYPILAQREGDRKRTGIILATKDAAIARLADLAETPETPVDLALETQLRAALPLEARQADRRLTLTLGEAPGYRWSLNGALFGRHAPLGVAAGERVEVTMINRTGMAHPMHLHGHAFQLVGIGGNPISGAMRDTILVPVMGHVTIAFNADNPGIWAFHCHNLYHMAAGMMTTLAYEDA
jgi:FtsP/CotA-like multicopper oxidase with cupredoxin domain